MKRTCTVRALVSDRTGFIAEKRWTGVDIMNTAPTRGWCTRQLNKHKHDGVFVLWECVHEQATGRGDAAFHHCFNGSMLRIQGSILRRGIFE